MKKFLFFTLMLMSAMLRAQPDLTGRWLSNSISEGTENVKMEFVFKDSVKMEMAFITDNHIPDVGRCLSRVSVQGTYSFIGPLFLTEIEQGSLVVKINKLELAGELAKQTPKAMIPALKKQLEAQMKQTAGVLFAGYDGGSMIYARDEKKDDEFHFILGDEKEAMDLVFKRQ